MQEFKQSENSAEYAALGYLKYAQAVTVQNVTKDGASAGKLQEGDAIDGVDGVPVRSLEQFQGLMEKTKPGQEVVLDFRRKNAPPGVATVKLAPIPISTTGSWASASSRRHGRRSKSTSTSPISAVRPRAWFLAWPSSTSSPPVT